MNVLKEKLERASLLLSGFLKKKKGFAALREARSEVKEVIELLSLLEIKAGGLEKGKDKK